jgi:DNA-binding MarR family transcriptional regulator
MNDKELLNLFTDMVRAHTAYMDRQLSSLGLSNGQGGVISVLGRYGSLTQNELARFRQVTPATISIMLDRMERDGLVARNTAKGNSRANSVRLTEKGLGIYQKLDAFMVGEPEAVFNGLSDEEKVLAADIFKKITENDVNRS